MELRCHFSSSSSTSNPKQTTGGATSGGATGTAGDNNSIGNTDTRVQTSSNTQANTSSNTNVTANGGSTVSYTTNNNGITPQDLALFGNLTATNSNPLSSSSGGGGVSAGGVTVMNPAQPAVTAITTAAASVRWYVWAGLAAAGLLAWKLFFNKKAK